MPSEEFEKFRTLVLRDMSLQKMLNEAGDREFVSTVVETGKQNGFLFSAEDVEEAMQANRRAWIERWI
jgi:EAL domain-containing protein (putative c-di-GMP-specific phosphodiesterase class I)